MGKTGKWFRSLFTSKKPPPGSHFPDAPPPPSKEQKKSNWTLSNPADYNNNQDSPATPYIEGPDANKHAIAVAAATAAVAEAALAAAQAAAEVVRLTSGGCGSGVNIPAYISRHGRRVAAALKIQSAFRAYLARRALRALKGLVKLQALVRGRIVRKQTADMLRRMQAMARIQARASAYRTHTSNTNLRPPPGVASTRNHYQRSDNAKHGGYISKQMSEYGSRPRLPSNWLNNWMEQYSWNNGGTLHGGDDERSDKILEIDTWKPRQTPRRSDGKMGREHSRMGPNPSVSSEEASSMISGDQIAVQTSPMVHSASSRQSSIVRGPFTPTRSECLFGEYLGGHPNFMANTESSRAKVRSQSAPKQRMQLDGVGRSSTFGQSIWESDAVSEKGFALPTNYRTAYLKRQGFRKYVE